MQTGKYAAAIVYVALTGALVAAGSARGIAQRQESRPDLAGRWTLNRELSEDAQAKLERMHSASSGGHGPARHGGGGGSGAGQAAQMEEVRDLLLNAPAWFVVTQDGERIVLTDNDGRVRSLTANGRKEKGNGRDVRTKWDDHRLVSEISLANATVIETYERSPTAPQLIVVTKMDMGGQVLSVRRVYDAQNPR